MSLTFKTPDEVEKHHSCYTQNSKLKEYFADLDEVMMAKRSQEPILFKEFLKIFIEADAMCGLCVDFPEIFDDPTNRLRHAMLRYTQ